MGKPTGFLDYLREPSHDREPLERIRDWNEMHLPLAEETLREQGGALHGLRRSLLPHRQADRRHGLGLPDQQPHPRVERPGLARAVEGGVHPPRQDQQLSRVHRPRLPRPLRGKLHGGHRSAGGEHQGAGGGHRRPRLRGGMGGGRSAQGAHRQARRRGGIGPGRTGGGRAAQPGRARGDGLRARRPHRRPPHVRHSQHEAGQEDRRPAGEAPRRGGRALRHRRRGGQGPAGRQAARRLRGHRPLRRRNPGARSAGGGQEPGRHLPGDGIPHQEHEVAARLRLRRRRAHLRQGQARHRHRRRRHRDRLRGHQRPAGRAQRHPAGDPSPPARRARAPTIPGRSGRRRIGWTTGRRKRRRSGAATRASIR